MTVLRTLREWLAWRTARRKWLRRRRDIKVLLALVLACVLCQVFGLACGVVGYVMQWLGIPPDDATSPVWDAEWDQVRRPSGVERSFPRLVPGIVQVRGYGIIAMYAGVA